MSASTPAGRQWRAGQSTSIHARPMGSSREVPGRQDGEGVAGGGGRKKRVKRAIAAKRKGAGGGVEFDDTSEHLPTWYETSLEARRRGRERERERECV